MATTDSHGCLRVVLRDGKELLPAGWSVFSISDFHSDDDEDYEDGLNTTQLQLYHWLVEKEKEKELERKREKSTNRVRTIGCISVSLFLYHSHKRNFLFLFSSLSFSPHPSFPLFLSSLETMIRTTKRRQTSEFHQMSWNEKELEQYFILEPSVFMWSNRGNESEARKFRWKLV